MKKRRGDLVTIFFLSFIFFFASCDPDPIETPPGTDISGIPEYIKIASFNIYRWGQSNDVVKNYEVLADLMDDFDLIAVQEVMPHHGEERIPLLLDELGEDYDFIITPATGNSDYSERYAYIYNKNKISVLDDGEFIVDDYWENNNFNRVPYMAYFKAGNFDFRLVNVHLLWGSNEADRTKETSFLSGWISGYIEAHQDPSTEQDLIVVGDFNRYGNGWSSFDQFLYEGYGDRYRILTLEPDTKLKTNCAKTIHETYDNIFISLGVNYEFGEQVSVLDETIGLIPWDTWDPWKDMTNAQIRKVISDHRPIWAKFRVDKADDDGE